MARRFACDKCEAKFASRQDLQRHLDRKRPCNYLVDGNDPTKRLSPFQCENCGQVFTTKMSKNRHKDLYCKAKEGKTPNKLMELAFHNLRGQFEELKKTVAPNTADVEISEDCLEVKEAVAGLSVEESKHATAEMKTPTYRRKIPAALRSAVWNKYIGSKTGEGLCFCCNLEPILRSNYECGHVTSAAKGGKAILANLRPVCSLCNKSMGLKDLYEFARECGFTLHVKCAQDEQTQSTKVVKDDSLKMSDEIYYWLYQT